MPPHRIPTEFDHLDIPLTILQEIYSYNDGNSMIELLFDVFESDLIEMLDLSDQTRKLIEGSK